VFLFERREGFCGHYASAFTALMRAAGVPARVVSGYLGGRWVQPLGGTPYLDLRQSDAHAWSEVWLPGRGWQRVDPSAWVGASASNPAGRVFTAAGPSSLEGWRLGAQWLQWQWWGLDLAWNRWWLGFDQAGQEALLERLFGDRRQALGLVLLGGAGGLLALGVGWLQWLQAPAGPPQRRRQLDRVLKRLEPRGLKPQAGETLETLAVRAQAMHLSQAPLLMQLASTYNQLRFKALQPSQQRRLQTQWKKLLRELERTN
jgi:hypothetical protein